MTNALAPQKAQLTLALRQFAEALSNLTDEQVPVALDMARELGRLAEDTQDALKQRALLYLNVHGQVVTEKGSRQARVGGFTVTAVPTRTGLDPKKVEPLLRRRGLEPSAHMKSTIKYDVDQARIDRLVAEGKLQPADVEACRYDKTYRLEVERESVE